MKKATKADIETIKKAFIENYSDAVTELNYTNDYELLIAIILSDDLYSLFSKAFNILKSNLLFI